MSRLASKKILQYYPTPTVVFPLIMRRIGLDAGGLQSFPIISILDPCAGEGWVLDQLRRRFLHYARTYAVEMGVDRAEKVRSLGFTQTVEADTVKEARFPKHAYDLLWFNPPYDHDDEAKRLEQAFFNRVVHSDRALTPGGVFIGLLPKTAMKTIWSSLRDYLTDMQVYRFPDPYYQPFHQFVIYGTMRSTKRRIDDPSHFQDDALLKQVLNEEVLPLDREDTVRYVLPSRNQEPPPIHSLKFDPSAGYQLAAQHGWMRHKNITDLFWPDPQPAVRTLLPLRPTFIGVTLAAGLFNGVPVRLADGKLVLLKGQTAKAQVYSTTKEIHTKKGDVIHKDTYIEQFRPRIYVLVLWSPNPTEIGRLIRYELPEPKREDDKNTTQKVATVS